MFFMLCPSVSRAFLCFVLLLVNAVPVHAPYVQDSLNADSEAAIQRTYTLQAQLEQDSKTNPKNAQANREKISLLGQARAELARVYTTPLSTEGTQPGGTQFPDGTQIAADSEFRSIQKARNTIIAGLPENAADLTNAEDLETLKSRLSEARQIRSEVETNRTRWLKAKPNDSDTYTRSYAQTRDASLASIKAELEAAKTHLETTGDATRFIDAEKALQAHQDAYGPLKSVNTLTSSPEAAQAKKEFETVAHATRVLEDAIRAKAARGESTGSHDAQHLVLLGKRAAAEQEMAKFQKAAEEKMREHRNRVTAGQDQAAVLKAEERTDTLAAESGAFDLGPRRSSADEFEQPDSPTSGRKFLGFGDLHGPDDLGGTFASTDGDAEGFTDTESSVEGLIAQRKSKLEAEIAKYQQLVKNSESDDVKKQQVFFEERFKKLNSELEELQRDTERRLPKPGITDPAERAAEKNAEDKRQQTAKIKFAQAQLTIQIERDKAEKELRLLEENLLGAAKQLKQAQQELAELEVKERALATQLDERPKTPEQIAAVEEDLRRDLMAREQFEEQVTTDEYNRLIASVENDARRAAAEKLFAQIDASEAADEDIPEDKRSNLLERFKKLKPTDQIELTRYLEHPDSKLPATPDGTTHPFAAFKKAAEKHSKLLEGAGMPADELSRRVAADREAEDDMSTRTQKTASVASGPMTGWDTGSVSNSLPYGDTMSASTRSVTRRVSDDAALTRQARAAEEDDGRRSVRTRDEMREGPPADDARSVVSGDGYKADDDGIPPTPHDEDMDTPGRTPRPRNAFAEMYEKEYENRNQQAKEQSVSPLTRARLYKEKAEAFAKARREVDAATRAEAEDAAQKANVVAEQEKKAFKGRASGTAQRIKADNDADLERLKGIIKRHAGVDATDEQARQLRVLAKANDYYKAIQETVEALQLQFAQDLKSAKDESDQLEEEIKRYQAAGDEVPEILLVAHKEQYDKMVAAQTKAADMLNAFKTDPVPFLTMKGQYVDKDTFDANDPRTSATNKAPSEQLRIFRDALASRGIAFWKEEDVTPEITNALNLLKHPETVLDDERDNPVKLAARNMSLRVRNLGDAVASGDIAASLAKTQKKLDGYSAPTADSLKQAAAIKKEITGLALSFTPEEAKEKAKERVARYQSTGKSELSEDSPSSDRQSDPVVSLVILQAKDGRLLQHSERNVYLMTEEEAIAETTLQAGDSSTSMVHVTLNLTDLNPEALEYQLRKSLVEEGLESSADDYVKAILPRSQPSELREELTGLQQLKKKAVTAAQEQTKVLDLLAAKRKDLMFKIAVKSVALKEDDQEDDDAQTDDGDEDTVIQKKIKEFDLAKADYLETLKNPDITAEDRKIIHENYHNYLREIIETTEHHLLVQEYPLRRENRDLLLGLNLEVLRELERPGVRNFNDDLDTRAKKQSLALTHLDAARAEDKERQLETETPSAAAKRALIEKEREALDKAIRKINKDLTETSSEDELIEAYAEQQRLKAKFIEDTHPIALRIKDDLAASPDERIAKLQDESKALRKDLAAQGKSSTLEANPRLFEENPRLGEIAELIDAEKRIKAKAEEARAVAHRPADNIAVKSARSGASASSGDHHKLAGEPATAGRDFKKRQRNDAAARKSPRQTPRR